MIFTLTIFILFTLYSRLNEKPINELLTENNSILLIEDEYDLKELDIEKGFLYLKKKKKDEEEILRVIDLKNGTITNNFILKK